MMNGGFNLFYFRLSQHSVPYQRLYFSYFCTRCSPVNYPDFFLIKEEQNSTGKALLLIL